MANHEELLKQLVILFTTAMREQELEILALQAVMNTLTTDFSGAMEQVETEKSNPVILAMIRSKYDDPLRTFHAACQQMSPSKAAVAMLQSIEKARTKQ